MTKEQFKGIRTRILTMSCADISRHLGNGGRAVQAWEGGEHALPDYAEKFMTGVVNSFHDQLQSYRLQRAENPNWEPFIEGHTLESRIAQSAWFFAALEDQEDQHDA